LPKILPRENSEWLLVEFEEPKRGAATEPEPRLEPPVRAFPIFRFGYDRGFAAVAAGEAPQAAKGPLMSEQDKVIELVLPDGKRKQHPAGITGRQAAEAIGKRLARDAVAVKINGEIRDLDRPLETGGAFAVITPKERNGQTSRTALEVLRHSAAHVMAEAVLRIWPGAKLVYGPTVDDGFYYDLDLDEKISTEDFAKIEAVMMEIIAADKPFARVELPRAEGLEKLRAEGNPYKLDNAQRAEGASLSFYVTGTEPGTDFEDLCRGPHLPSTGRIGAAKVTSVAGAYWHGDAAQQQLQRLYGTAFFSREELDAHLTMLDEAKKRDHRALGRKMGIYVFDEDVGPGLPLWLPNGAAMIEELERLAKETEFAAGYQRVRTPHICKETMYLTSGHLPYYQESMFPPMEFEGVKYYLKPMNCPHHHKIFAAEMRSYRDLPLRLAEYGACYRYEQSGELFGLMRVRSMLMNDAHIYCTLEQFEAEFLAVCGMYLKYFKIFNIEKYQMRFSTHGVEGLGKKYVNQPELWLKTEDMVRRALEKGGVPYVEVADEAAFYGPKIDVQIWSAIGREFTLATNQVDFAIPERFGLVYKGPGNRDETPLCIHRAPLSTHERLIGYLLEHYAGAFPTWLAPVQVRVANITDKEEAAGRDALEKLRGLGVRADADFGSEKINAKIAEAEVAKIPFILVIGKREAENGTVSVRGRGGKQLGVLPLSAFIADVKAKIDGRSDG
jgi:threonyl-tRNA synthetase